MMVYRNLGLVFLIQLAVPCKLCYLVKYVVFLMRKIVASFVTIIFLLISRRLVRKDHAPCSSSSIFFVFVLKT